MIFVMIIPLAAIGFFGARGLILKRYWKEFILYSSLFLFGAVLSILQAMGIELPDPNKAIQYLFVEILHLHYK